MAQEDNKSSGKLGPQPGRSGSDLYPGFYGTVPAGYGRLRRLEKGSQRLQRGQFRPTVGTYTRLPKSALVTKSTGIQIIDISKGSVRKIGGVSNQGTNGAFGWTSTGTSITWYWDGTNSSTVPVIKRADGSSFTVPTTGSGLTITGLANSTDYYFLPFWDIDNLCNIGWVQGTVGTPQIAFVLADTTSNNSSGYLLEQSLQGNEPLSASYMKATTAVGGGSGGGGGTACVRAGTEIYTLGDLPYHVNVMSEQHWIHLRIEDGRELYCTLDHPLYDTFKGRVTADSLVPGDIILTDIGEQKVTTSEFKYKACSKYEVVMEKGHLYYANGFLSHNQKIFH